MTRSTGSGAYYTASIIAISRGEVAVMARSLTSTLIAAVGAATRVPAVACTVEDHIQHFAQYQTPGNADAWNDACVANDGSIVRVQVTRGGSGFVSNFQFQRVTNPATASQ